MDPLQRDAIRVDRPRRFWPWLLGIGTLGVLATSLWRGPEEGLPPRESLAEPLTRESSPVTTAPLDTEVTPSLDPARPLSARRDIAVARTRPVGSSAPVPIDSDTLWTQTWVNVRERPGTTSTVVKILTPGKPVAVVNPEREWSLVYVDGLRVGYLSVALLANQPPTP